VVKAKPAAAKGKYVKKITMTSTMGPGITIDLTEWNHGCRRVVARRTPAERTYEETQRKQQDLDKLKTEIAKYRRFFSRPFRVYGRKRTSSAAPLQARWQVQVGKNTLADAPVRAPRENLLKNLSGTNSIAYTAPTGALAKAHQVAKDVPAFSVQVRRGRGPRHSIREISSLRIFRRRRVISKIMFC